jgi:hypothetical protein
MGLPVAGIRDLLAMKLKVIGDRGELRDYVDILEIERRTPHRTEQGLSYYQHWYGVAFFRRRHPQLVRSLRALGHTHGRSDRPRHGDPEELHRSFFAGQRFAP